METMFRYIGIILISYLLGSLNFSIIISKLFLKKDIRKYGSGNAGTTNSLRVMGIGKTVFVILGDILKNIVAMLLVGVMMDGYGDHALAQVLAGAACILGHSFPVYFGFRGGKGVLSTAAVFVCIDWRICLIALSIFIIIVAITKYVSLGSMIAVATVAIQFVLFYGITADSIKYICFATILALFIIFLHRTNIRRLIAGQENKLSFKKK